MHFLGWEMCSFSEIISMHFKIRFMYNHLIQGRNIMKWDFGQKYFTDNQECHKKLHNLELALHQ